MTRFVLLKANSIGQSLSLRFPRKDRFMWEAIPLFVRVAKQIFSVYCGVCLICLVGCLLINLGPMTQFSGGLHVGCPDFPAVNPCEFLISFVCIIAQTCCLCLGIWGFHLIIHRVVTNSYHHKSVYCGKGRISRHGRRTHSCTDRCTPAVSLKSSISTKRLGNNRIHFRKSHRFQSFYNYDCTCSNEFVYNQSFISSRHWFDFLGTMVIYPAISFAIVWYITCSPGFSASQVGSYSCHRLSHTGWYVKSWRLASDIFHWFHWVRPPKHLSLVWIKCCRSLAWSSSRKVLHLIQTMINHCPCRQNIPGLALVVEQGRVWGWRGVRVGEAKNPGPEGFRKLELSTFNPTQLLGKEPEICALGQGVYGACETSTTQLALKSIQPKFRKSGFFTTWSKCVDPQRPKNSLLRGKASGTAIISSYPLRPFWDPPSKPSFDSHRFCDAIIQLSANTCLYFATMYGYVNNPCHVDPLGSTNRLFTEIAERALNFQGPAAIVGDFNWDLHELTAWKTLCKVGWVDTAVLDGQLYQREPQPTYKDCSRRMFILVNRHLAESLQSCRTCDDFLFGGHPLLNSVFDMCVLDEPVLHWVLPLATDDLLFDADLAEDQAQVAVHRQGHNLQVAIDSGNHNEAAKVFAKMVEHTWIHSVVDVEGNHMHLKSKHLGRENITPLKQRFSSVPVVRKARDGDFDPQQGQLNISLRRHTRQLRRLQSLSCQLRSWERNQDRKCQLKCEQLWKAVLDCPGFPRSFAAWVGSYLGWFVPLSLPHHAYIVSLTKAFEQFHQSELHWYFLQKRRCRKLSVALDCAKGGPNAFRDIRDDPPAPLSYVVESHEFKVRKTRWPKVGRDCIIIDHNDNLQVGFPLHFQGQTAIVTKVQGCNITIDKPFKLRSDHFVATQKVATANPKCMHRKILETWNTHWKRDSESPNNGLWDNLEKYLEFIPQRPPLNKKPFCWETWREHCRGLNTKAARGGCGYSVNEMIRFPRTLVEQLFKIFDACEDGNRWPDNWILARVTMLSKSDHPVSPFDSRPITVFSVLYRQWSRYRSREILEYYSTFMPSTVALATNRVPADISAAMTALKIEMAINKNEVLCGLGVDLVRCFNTLPRAPICEAMKRMGVPLAYINAWANMLQHMSRSLLVGSSQGEPSQSTTGAPEGCGMSVTAMATVSWWIIKVLESTHPTIDPSCYADNWQVLSSDPHPLIDATSTMKDFVEFMKMAIAPSKSYLWATTQAARKKLRGVLVGNIAIPVVTNYSDLGCDIHCSKKVTKPKFQKRLSKAKRIFKRIPNSSVPKNFKLRLIKGAGFTTANYGSAIQRTPKTVWRTLRSNVARCLSLQYPAASSWLAVSVTTGDPQCHHLETVCNFWRRFIKTFPQLGLEFLSMVGNPSLCKNGPAANFRRTLLDCGWNVMDDPQFIHHFGGLRLHWLACSKKWLRQGLTSMWNNVVHKAVKHRKDCGDGIPDFGLANDVLRSLTTKDQWAMRVLMSGKQFTHDIISKFATDMTNRCPLCGKLDNKSHRIFNCEALEHIRTNHKDALTFAQKQPECFRLLGIPMVQNTSWLKLSQNGSVTLHDHTPANESEFRHFFLDGSAYHQDVRELTISGWAIVESQPGYMRFSHVDSGVVPGGEHSSYRGESMALLRVLERFPYSHLYSDCQAVVDNFLVILNSVVNHKPCPNFDHFDIWGLIWQVMVSRAPEAHTITKVKAHCKIQPSHGVMEQWLIRGNNKVDEYAKAAVCRHPLFNTLAKDYKERARYKLQFGKYVKCLCALANETFKITSAQKSEHSRGVTHLESPSFLMWIALSTDVHYCFPEWDVLHVTCPFGKTFYERVAAWFCKLHWPHPSASYNQGISLLELYADFVVESHSESPINDQKRGCKAEYYLLDSDPLLQEAGAPLQKHTKTWVTFWKWAIANQLVDAPLSWDESKPVSHIGYSLRSGGFTVRPGLTHTEISLKWLWSYFHTPTGRRRNLSSPLRPWYTCLG